jgi:hypothetical protein
VGYVSNEKITPLPGDVEAARAQAISFAAYRVIRSRFLVTDSTNANYPGWINFTGPAIDSLLNSQYGAGSTTTAQAAINPTSTAPAEVGKRIGQAILTWGATDGFATLPNGTPGYANGTPGASYPQAYTATINPNLNRVMSVEGSNIYVFNAPLGSGVPYGTDPNLWQPLDLATSIDQSGLIQASKQTFVGVQSLATTPFSLTRTDRLKPWFDPFGGPSKVSTDTFISTSDASYKAQALAVIRDGSVLNSTATKDISPGAIGNNPLGADTGLGYAINPVTNAPYVSNVVKIGDFTRCLAEFWADGPSSETPPGHWHVLANEMSDDPLVVKKIKGTGPIVNDLEWDVKMYFSIAGSVHDAACAAWSLKRYYSGTRPITLLRWLCTNGQSTNAALPGYNPLGIPTETDVCEEITNATAALGGKHQRVYSVEQGTDVDGIDYLGKIAVRCWPGENAGNPGAATGLPATIASPVRWILGTDWLPFQPSPALPQKSSPASQVARTFPGPFTTTPSWRIPCRSISARVSTSISNGAPIMMPPTKPASPAASVASTFPKTTTMVASSPPPSELPPSPWRRNTGPEPSSTKTCVQTSKSLTPPPPP